LKIDLNYQLIANASLHQEFKEKKNSRSHFEMQKKFSAEILMV